MYKLIVKAGTDLLGILPVPEEMFVSGNKLKPEDFGLQGDSAKGIAATKELVVKGKPPVKDLKGIVENFSRNAERVFKGELTLAKGAPYTRTLEEMFLPAVAESALVWAMHEMVKAKLINLDEAVKAIQAFKTAEPDAERLYQATASIVADVIDITAEDATEDVIETAAIRLSDAIGVTPDAIVAAFSPSDEVAGEESVPVETDADVPDVPAEEVPAEEVAGESDETGAEVDPVVAQLRLATQEAQMLSVLQSRATERLIGALNALEVEKGLPASTTETLAAIAAESEVTVVD